MHQPSPCFVRSIAVIAMVLSPLVAAAAASPSREALITLPASSLPLLAGSRATIDREPALRKSLAGESIHMVRIDEAALPGLAEAIHHDLQRCAGFVRHDSPDDARAWLARSERATPAAPLARPIDAQAVVRPLLGALTETRLLADIRAFSELRPTRLYTSPHGRAASDWLASHWRELAGGRNDITIETVPLTGFPQRQESVVLSIKGSEKPDEVIVIGSHLDSISSTADAPGADDDASGVASATSIIRAMVANGYRPQRTVRFIAHAAEEGGLIGSQQIARRYRSDGIEVVGMLQLDMTAYKGAPNDINLMTDYTDAAQNDFVEALVRSYLPGVSVGRDKCGYACSDHASWSNAGYPASMPFEATLRTANPNIHTPRDTVASFGGTAAHAIKFARLGMAFAAELAND
ncbi:MAG TPA: M20/M25/M40 family metallo-hydrolase [Luteibacter sp.]|nr:M20/M25/M40 family metallo-hydrolase [Luteibacter sp.]